MQCAMPNHCWSQPGADGLRECLWCLATGKDVTTEMRCRVCGDTTYRCETVDAKEDAPAYIEAVCEQCPNDNRGEYEIFNAP